MTFLWRRNSALLLTIDMWLEGIRTNQTLRKSPLFTMSGHQDATQKAESSSVKKVGDRSISDTVLQQPTVFSSSLKHPTTKFDAIAAKERKPSSVRPV